MALNFTHCAMFPVNPSEGELASSIRIPDMFAGERNRNSFAKPQQFDYEMEDSYNFMERDRGDESGGGVHDPIANDILDLLPSDPFGMDLSATFTAIADWLEDFEIESGLNLFWDRAMVFESGPSNVGVGSTPKCGNAGSWLENFGTESGLDLFLDRAKVLESCSANVGVGQMPNVRNSNSRFDGLGSVEVMELGHASCSSHDSMSVWGVDEFLSLCNEDTIQNEVSSDQSMDLGEYGESCSYGDERMPHEALLLALGYLEVQDLLSAERVCRSFRLAIQNDALLWRSICIDHPLNERITDDGLFQLTRRAQGSLQSLSLVECARITDDGIKRVLESNPRLTKLSVPGCTRLSIGGLVSNLKAFKSSAVPGIKCLRIGGLYGITEEHFEELRLLLDADKCQQPGARKPRFFHSGYSSLSYDDESPIDIETCPKCQKLRLVYDCPANNCQGKQASAQQCRACIFCTARCVHCGRCINDGEYEETFCLDLLCGCCWRQVLQCQ